MNSVHAEVADGCSDVAMRSTVAYIIIYHILMSILIKVSTSISDAENTTNQQRCDEKNDEKKASEKDRGWTDPARRRSNLCCLSYGPLLRKLMRGRLLLSGAVLCQPVVSAYFDRKTAWSVCMYGDIIKTDVQAARPKRSLLKSSLDVKLTTPMCLAFSPAPIRIRGEFEIVWHQAHYLFLPPLDYFFKNKALTSNSSMSKFVFRSNPSAKLHWTQCGILSSRAPRHVKSLWLHQFVPDSWLVVLHTWLAKKFVRLLPN